MTTPSNDGIMTLDDYFSSSITWKLLEGIFVPNIHLRLPGTWNACLPL